MKKVFTSPKIMLGVNIAVILAVFVLNYFYQRAGFSFTLKCVCSICFAFIGLLNLGCAVLKKESNIRFYIFMASGLFFAMLGDIVLKYSFIFGASIFAFGHICFVLAYCYLQKIKGLDFILSGILALLSVGFLIFFPLLKFEVPIFRIVCIVYALIICCMLGKAVGNFIRKRNTVTGVIAISSLLFFFSDLMLVLDWFVGIFRWTDHACMGTYYPALCFLALSMLIKTFAKGKGRNKNE